MILKASHIARRLVESDEISIVDPLVITPRPDVSKLANSSAASVDLRLGTWFVTLRQTRMSHLHSGDVAAEPQLTKTHYVPFGSEYWLHPRSFVLGVTLEWIRMPTDLAAYVVGKSSWGRRGLIIATAVGVHPGFKGCLTLELSNVGELPVAIRPGVPICQLFLHTTDGVDTAETDQSQFVGLRKPTLGKVPQDEIARKLADAQNIRLGASQLP
ncbi:MAG: dcd [Chthonomonadaceae bacterium]|nr:dcd [Chthonomonadaceae bacterium]